MNTRPLVLLPWFLFALPGCPEPETEGCGEFDQVFAWEDADGDGYGAHVPQGWVCELGPNQSTNDGDCDDARDDVRPGSDEICDLTDNDCDGFIDEETPGVPWYPDNDGDTWGDGEAMEVACEQPGASYTRTAGDCDDTRAEVNPASPEICNEGVDDDCDGFADDADAGVDPTTFVPWYRDADQDGYGDPLAFLERCAQPQRSVPNGDDCDDTDPVVNPDNQEICNHGFDDDCDGLADDADDSVDPSSFQYVVADKDGDLFGSQTEYEYRCYPPPRNNRLDCDDNDPLANVTQDWYVDTDGDLSGTPPSVVTQCLNPGGGLAPEHNGEDCAPSNPQIYPDQDEDCFDGVDNNCDDLADCEDPACNGVPGCAPPCADDIITDPLPIRISGNTAGQRNDASPGCAYSNADDVIFWWVPPTTRQYTIDLAGSAYDTTLYVRDTCGGIDLACNDDAIGLQSRVQLNLTAGQGVLIHVDGFGLGSGSFTLNIN